MRKIHLKVILDVYVVQTEETKHSIAESISEGFSNPDLNSMLSVREPYTVEDIQVLSCEVSDSR